MPRTLSEDANGNRASAAMSAVDTDVSALRKDIDALRSDVSALLKHSSTFVDAKSRQNIEKGVEASKEFADTAAKQIKVASSAVEDKIRANPLASVGIALGAGIALSLLYRK